MTSYWPRVVRLVVAILAAFLWTIAIQFSADAQTAPTPAPKLIAASTTVRMEIQKASFTDTRATTGTVTGHLLISNQGTGSTGPLQVSGQFTNGVPVTMAATPLDALQVNGHVSLTLSFAWTNVSQDTGILVIEDGGLGPPLTVPFTIREKVVGSVFSWAALWAAFAAFLVVLLTWFKLMPQPGGGDKSARPALSAPVFPVATWTFSGSWASSLTALGAILATALAAAGFLTDVLPGLSTGLFVGVNLGYLLLASLATVVFIAAHNEAGKPTYLALLLASWVTLWAVIGELVTLAQLAARGGFPLAWILIAAVAMAIVMYRYTSRSLLQVLLAKERPPGGALGGAGSLVDGPTALL